MEITPDEIYVIKKSLEARKEWAESDHEISDEVEHIDSALDKLNTFKFVLTQSLDSKSGGEE